MGKTIVTGAGGMVGRETLKALDEADVTPVTHREHDDIDSVILDVENQEAVREAVDGHDTVVHLAANPNADAEWDSILSTNIDGTYNVYEAAVAADADRVVFASTNHTTMMYNTVKPGKRGTTVAGSAEVIRPDDVFRPDSYYGVSKVACEALGSYYADWHGLEVINLRIGWLLTEDELREKQDMEEARARFARALWLSPRDWRDAVRKAVGVSIDESPLTLHVASRNDDRFLTLTETIQSLGYRPRDNSAEVLEDSP